MKFLYRSLSLLLILTLVLTTGGCSKSRGIKGEVQLEQPIKIGVLEGPLSSIMNNVKVLAAKEGLQLEVVEFDDPADANQSLLDGELFANCLQSSANLAAVLKEDPDLNLKYCFNTVNLTMAVYSRTLKKGAPIPKGAMVGLPQGDGRRGRALRLLDQAKLIRLRDNAKLQPDLFDITANPYELKFQSMDETTLAHNLPKLSMAVIGANAAVAAWLNPTRDALFTENPDNPYVQVFVTTQKNFRDPRIIRLQKLYQSADNEKFITERYKGIILPGWK